VNAGLKVVIVRMVPRSGTPSVSTTNSNVTRKQPRSPASPGFGFHAIAGFGPVSRAARSTWHAA
jgi:hypothetical protein